MTLQLIYLYMFCWENLHYNSLVYLLKVLKGGGLKFSSLNLDLYVIQFNLTSSMLQFEGKNEPRWFTYVNIHANHVNLNLIKFFCVIMNEFQHLNVILLLFKFKPPRTKMLTMKRNLAGWFKLRATTHIQSCRPRVGGRQAKHHAWCPLVTSILINNIHYD